MSWNEPGGGDRDPWGGGNKNQGPPDLEEAIKNFQKKLSGIFGGKKGPSSGNGSSGGNGFNLSINLTWVFVIIAAIWAATGFYIVAPAEEAVVTRFGEYNRTEPEGPHWLPTFFERAELINVKEVRTAEIGYRGAGRSSGSVPHEALMLTSDQNIIDVQFAVQYRIKDAKDYLFRVRDPDISLRHATESAVREIVGRNDMDYILTEGRDLIASDAKTLIQEVLDRYSTGLYITSVNLLGAQPPAQVQEAFDDAVKAEEDEERLKNEAEAYANDIIPKSRGEADAMRSRAEAYKQRVIAIAEGETSRFTAVLKEYKKAPEVTRERMYLDTIEKVFGSTSKILMDKQGSNNLLYLPLDQMMSKMSSTSDTTSRTPAPFEPRSTFSTSGTPQRSDASRGRSR